ncbi:uncharacterized protein LOC124287450 isoform X3 [Haliotis rubra]|uniref:uncharacterized protein LOC124287450 isoform X3 n=1 Tax=Haliotis rubra TaxID=36100 RepID=UPI001EE50A64|nr:uncharacterized protein LOC124287450 isoform X3 [Haliotis rubra]
MYFSKCGSEEMAFNHDNHPMTLRQYYDTHFMSLPSFISVTQGYYGGREMEVLGSGQVLRIHSSVHQRRAVAVDANKRTLSIPTNYALKFRVINSNNKAGKEEDVLANILSKKPLPVTVQISDRRNVCFTLDSSQQNVQALGQLTITDVYEETYFLANAILYGKPDDIPLLIPLYLGDIMVASVTGLQGKSQEEWETYVTYINTMCKRVQIPLDTGLREIALYSPQSIQGSDNVYDFIEPSSYIIADWDGKKATDTRAVTRVTSGKPPKPPKPLPPPQTDSRPPQLPKRSEHKPTRRFSEDAATSNQYVNDIGRAVVNPFTALAKAAAEKTNKGEYKLEKAASQGQVSEYAIVEENKPLESMSIDEIVQKLKELKLDKHAKAFREQGVDGPLALELDETILKEDFKFSKFEILKFMKFVETGHIPH